ncbi:MULTISPECIES: STAS domain-containing protein [unclassified Nocardioides]|uniref:STAS domain-containing protein n=1 Tax=unclassified Nocardioides TaxID=2615069 RepID=UPI0036205C07
MRTDLSLVCAPPMARLAFSGELDLASLAHLRAVLLRVRLRGCDHVEVDADGVTFVDAATLRALHQEQRRLRHAGGSLEVVAASPAYLLVSGLAGYDNLEPVSGRQRRLTLLRGGVSGPDR